MESNNERVFSDQGIQEIADALGIDTSALNEPFTGEIDEEGDQVYFDADDVDGTVSGIGSGTDTSTGSDVGSEPLALVWPIYIVQPPTIKTSAGGAKTVDIILEFDAVDGATGYEYQMVPV